ncbi:MAG TPA: hypothetical protein VES88_12425 [Gemmatimonadaceae bacterium]|nr:hypothetical protein [Gemmatimonadaceae bacterium]
MAGEPWDPVERDRRYASAKRDGLTRLLTEGDSWFDYPPHPNIVDWLEAEGQWAIKRLENLRSRSPEKRLLPEQFRVTFRQPRSDVVSQCERYQVDFFNLAFCRRAGAFVVTHVPFPADGIKNINDIAIDADGVPQRLNRPFMRSQSIRPKAFGSEGERSQL